MVTDLPKSLVRGMTPPAPQLPTALTDSTLPHHHLHACPKNFQHVRRSFSTSHPSDNKGLFWLSDFLSVWSFPVNQRLLSRPLQLPACLLAFDCLWPKHAMLPLPARDAAGGGATVCRLELAAVLRWLTPL